MKSKALSSSPVILLAGMFVASQTLAADSKKEARVTQIIRDVKLLPSEQAARPAAVNDKVSEDTGVRTGSDSRSELTFADLTITRLGSNTIFSFNKAGREAEVDSGSILLRVPKDSGGGRIKTSAVTVAITGTTVIFESTRGGNSKLITLEGGARVSLVKHRAQSQYVRAGQMLAVPAGATTLPRPVNVDLDQIMKTSPLIIDFRPLPSQDLIAAAIQEQRRSPPQAQPAAGQPGGSAGGWPVYPGPILGGYPGRPPRDHNGNGPGRPPKGASPPIPQRSQSSGPAKSATPRPTPPKKRPNNQPDQPIVR
jgi:hypothetical protein